MKIKLIVIAVVKSEDDLKVSEFTSAREMTDIQDPLELPILASAFASILAGKIDELSK